MAERWKRYRQSKLYRTWANMRQRCYNPKNPGYYLYGALGITICDKWINNPTEFEKWSKENGYAPKLTIDRIDGSKGYSPENCRWTTYYQQTRNLKTNVMLTFNGKTKCAKDWANDPLCIVSYDTILYRLRQGLSAKQAITKEKYLRHEMRTI